MSSSCLLWESKRPIPWLFSASDYKARMSELFKVSLVKRGYSILPIIFPRAWKIRETREWRVCRILLIDSLASADPVVREAKWVLKAIVMVWYDLPTTGSWVWTLGPQLGLFFGVLWNLRSWFLLAKVGHIGVPGLLRCGQSSTELQAFPATMGFTPLNHKPKQTSS